MPRNVMWLIALLLFSSVLQLSPPTGPIDLAYGAADDPNPPQNPVRLIFIHHSTGENWLADENGGLGLALRDNNYYVSDTNYDWGPDAIGSYTDFGQWWLWFRGPDSSTYLNALYSESEQYSAYSRMDSSPGGENEIIMFKSCFPNSALLGEPSDPVPPIDDNPLRGQDTGSEYHTVANAKGIYMDLLEYFRTRPDKLFIVITAPPQSDPTFSSNARAFNEWLMDDWLRGYPHRNVFVFDFYNVLTTNGGNPNRNDLDQETGNHHRWWNNAIQHKTDGDKDDNPNVLEYPTEDDHPSRAGNLKATAEFLPLLNVAYNRWKGEGVSVTTTAAEAETTAPPEMTEETTVAETEAEETPQAPTGEAFPIEMLAIAGVAIVVVVALAVVMRGRRRTAPPSPKAPSPTPTRPTAVTPPAAGEKFCVDCGSRIPGPTRFCPNCGARQP